MTVFLIDGLRQEVFAEELAAGRLPNLEQAIASGGFVENGITAFPSMTGYAYYPFVTGHDAESDVSEIRSSALPSAVPKQPPLDDTPTTDGMLGGKCAE